MFSNILNIHRVMIADKIRTESYRKAICETVKKGDIVADIGTGTGILAFFACQAGAKKVYAIERTNMIEVAKQVAKDNNFSDRIIFIKGDSNTISLPEKVDIIISETLGSFALEEGILSILYDARERFLKSNGIIIPSSITLCVVPIEAPMLYHKIKFWDNNLYGLDFSVIRDLAVNTYYPGRVKPNYFLSTPQAIDHFELKRMKRIIIDGTGANLLEKPGILHGLLGWFNARLSKNIVLTNSPLSPATHWYNIFFPISPPSKVKKGDLIRFRINGNPLGIKLKWDIEITNRIRRRSIQKISFKHSAFKVWYLSEEAIKTIRGYFRQYRPQISELGKVELFILNLCKRGKNIQEISKALKIRYPLRYKTTIQAIEKVADVISKYDMMIK